MDKAERPGSPDSDHAIHTALRTGFMEMLVEGFATAISMLHAMVRPFKTIPQEHATSILSSPTQTSPVI